MKAYRRFAHFLVGSLLILLVPISSNAGLIRIDFDVVSAPYQAFGLGYMQFEDDIDFGVSTPISSLTNLDWSLGVAWIQGYSSYAVFDTENDGNWYGNIIIDTVSENVYTASFTSSVFYNFMGNSTFPTSMFALSNSDGFMADATGQLLLGDYQASVWFSDPLSAPVPSSALLLAFAVVPVFVLKRRVSVSKRI